MNKHFKNFLHSQMEESQTIRQEEKDMKFSKYWLAAKFFKWAFAFAIGVVGFFFWSCAPKIVTVTEYQTVETPVKCSIEIPTKPTAEGDVIELNYKILKYAHELETALKACR